MNNPDNSAAPTQPPASSPAAALRAMGVIPVSPGDWPEDFSHENGNYQCHCHNCGADFIGHKRRILCKQCGEPPAPLAGGTEGMDWADLLASNLKACDIISVRDMERVSKQAREHLTLWLNSGSVLEGRPVSPAIIPQQTYVEDLVCESPTTGMKSYHRRFADGSFESAAYKTEYPTIPAARAAVSPATGEREAELRELVIHTTAAHENLFDVAIPHSSELDAALCLALTPLLDRREAEHEALKRSILDLTHPNMRILLDEIADRKAELAAKEAQLTTAHTHMDKLREHRNELDAACHELEGKLRESEAARGEAEKDSGRLDWLFKNWDGRHSKLLEKPFATYGYDPAIPSFRVAIDRKWSDEDAARAQEAKP